MATSTAIIDGTANAMATALGGNAGTAFGGNVGDVSFQAISGIAGAANANSFATTINGNTAQAQSTANGSNGQAQATAKTQFANVLSVQSTATGQVGGAPVNAFAQIGTGVPISNAINGGQSFSVVSPLVVGPFLFAHGAMGSGYGGTGTLLAYQQSAEFILNSLGGAFLVDLLGNVSLGNGFESAAFQIFSNGNLIESDTFNDLASAQAFFSNNLLAIGLVAGLNDIQLLFSATMGSGAGFGFDYIIAAGPLSESPLSPSWIMMLIGLVSLSLFSFHQNKKSASATVAA